MIMWFRPKKSPVLDEMDYIFGAKSLSAKRAYLRSLIARERADKSKGEQG